MESPKEAAATITIANRRTGVLRLKSKDITIDLDHPSDEEIEHQFWGLEAQHHIFGTLTEDGFNRAKAESIRLERGLADKNLPKLVDLVKNKDLTQEQEKKQLAQSKKDLVILKNKLGELDKFLKKGAEIIGSEEKKMKKVDEKLEIIKNTKEPSKEQLAEKKELSKEQKKIIRKIERDNEKLDELKALPEEVRKKEEEIEKLNKIAQFRETGYPGLSPEQKKLIDLYPAILTYETKLVLYKKLFRLCKIIADQVEINNNANDNLAYTNAYNMLTMFEGEDLYHSITNFTGYVNNVLGGGLPLAIIHDAFAAVHLPNDGQLITLDKWRELFRTKGLRAVKLFARADQVEKKKAADEIEKRKAEENTKTHVPPATIDEAEAIHNVVIYKRFAENPEFGSLCIEHAVGEAVFNRCLDLMRAGKKTKDNLPDTKVSLADLRLTEAALTVPQIAVQIPEEKKAEFDLRVKLVEVLAGIVDAKETEDFTNVIEKANKTMSRIEKKIRKAKEDKEKARQAKETAEKAKTGEAEKAVTEAPKTAIKKVTGYWLVKLPVNDPRAYILGEITHCCQNIGGKSEKCIIDGVTKENNGFYVLLYSKEESEAPPIKDDGKIDYERYEIVGQAYAWISKEGNLVFDSWENLRPENEDPIIVPMLKRLAEKITEEDRLDISRVMVGKSFNTPAYWANHLAMFSDAMKEGYQYTDSLNQSMVYESKRLLKKRQEIQNMFPQYSLPFGQIISCNQANRLLAFIKEDENLQFMNIFLETANKLLKDIPHDPSGFVLESLITHPYTNQITDLRRFYEELLNILKSEPSPYSRFLTLSSKRALDAYLAGASFYDLKDLGPEKIELFVSDNAIKAYKAGVRFGDFKDIVDPEKIKLLISDSAIKAYEAGVKITDLKDLDVNKIELLISYWAREAYEAGAKATDLKALDPNKFELLTSSVAIEIYKLGAVTFADLKDLDPERIRLLTSDRAKIAYIFGLKFDNLKGLSIDKIRLLICETIIRRFNLTLNSVDFGGLSAEKIELLASNAAVQAYEAGIKFADLKDLNPEKIELLISDSAKAVYANINGPKFADLKDLDPERIRLLISDGVRDAYMLGVKFTDLKDLDPERIRLLTSDRARATYRAGAKLTNLKDLDPEKIELLTSSGVIEALSARATFADLKNLENLDPKKFELLTSDAAKGAYKAGVKFTDLKDLDPKEIKLFTSLSAIKAYASGAKFADLNRLDREKLELLLVSNLAIRAYAVGVKFADLKDLDTNTIQMFFSSGHIQKIEGAKMWIDGVELNTVDLYDDNKINEEDQRKLKNIVNAAGELIRKLLTPPTSAMVENFLKAVEAIQDHELISALKLDKKSISDAFSFIPSLVDPAKNIAGSKVTGKLPPWAQGKANEEKAKESQAP